MGHAIRGKWWGTGCALVVLTLLGSGFAQGQSDSNSDSGSKPRRRIVDFFRAKTKDPPAAFSVGQPSWRNDPSLQDRGVFDNYNAPGNDSRGRVDPYRLPTDKDYPKLFSGLFAKKTASSSSQPKPQPPARDSWQDRGATGGYPAQLPPAPTDHYGPAPLPAPPVPPAPVPETAPVPPPRTAVPQTPAVRPALPTAPLPPLTEPDFPAAPSQPREF